MDYQLEIIGAISGLDADEWNDLGVRPYPFLRHEFLAALEQEGCLGERYGWLPRHLAVTDAQGALVAAAPMYLKFNSYGEFVFDWSWADAYARHGLQYYPKLVSASPYTPATGPKLLRHQTADDSCVDLLIHGAIGLAKASGCSSVHWLFPPTQEVELLRSHGLMRRTGCQFHWHNAGYTDFNHYLQHFSSAKRKSVRRERRKVREAGIEFRLLDGHAASDADWIDFHELYESTFQKRGGIPTLSLAFFQRIAATMPDAVLLVQARHEGQPVAAAFNLVGESTLYGRHWGCREEFDGLHFEACYYQGLDFCIRRGFNSFEPGAQGEHKISRGFLPTPTWSAHWLADANFTRIVDRYLRDEDQGMHQYMQELAQHSPFKSADDA